MFSMLFFFFNDTATTEIYTYCHTLSLHDALPITSARRCKTVNDRLKTRLVDILIRFVALLDRLAGPAPAFRRIPANGPRSVLPVKIFWRAVAPRFRPDGCGPGHAENCGLGGRQIEIGRAQVRTSTNKVHI